MIKTVEAIIDRHGNVHLCKAVRLTRLHRALVMILDEPPMVSDTALLSEASLASDWLQPEEDEAWAHLQAVQ